MPLLLLLLVLLLLLLLLLLLPPPPAHHLILILAKELAKEELSRRICSEIDPLETILTTDDRAF